MPTVASRFRPMIFALSCMAALSGDSSTLAAQEDGPKAPKPPRIYFGSPITPASARTWATLQKKADFQFEPPVSLMNLIKAVEAKSFDKNNQRLFFFVDPIGLQEASVTLESTVTMDVTKVKIGTGLQAALDQLDLAYFVTPKGDVCITSAASAPDVAADPQLLDRLDALEKEVVELRAAIKAQKPNR